jgi:hypothetical protein
MAAEAPANKPRLMKVERFDDRSNRAGMPRKRIGAGVVRVIGFAVARKIDGDQPDPSA